VEKPETNRSLGAPIRRGEDNIKMYLRDIGSGEMDWTDVHRRGTGGGLL
jgi:hypothetical protein